MEKNSADMIIKAITMIATIIIAVIFVSISASAEKGYVEEKNDCCEIAELTKSTIDALIEHGLYEEENQSFWQDREAEHNRKLEKAENYVHEIKEPDWVVNEDDFVFTPEYNSDGSINYFGWNKEDYDYLVMALVGECHEYSWKHQMYVGSVIINRMECGYRKATSIKEVCLSPSQYSCFTKDGNAYREPTEWNKKIAYDLLKYGSILPWNVLFQAEFVQEDGVYEQIDNTYFCFWKQAKLKQ